MKVATWSMCQHPDGGVASVTIKMPDGSSMTGIGRHLDGNKAIIAALIDVAICQHGFSSLKVELTCCDHNFGYKVLMAIYKNIGQEGGMRFKISESVNSSLGGAIVASFQQALDGLLGEV